MSIFNKIKSRNNDDGKNGFSSDAYENDNTVKNTGYIEIAEKIEDIVHKGIEEDDFKSINKNLKNLPVVSAVKNSFIFENHSDMISVSGLILCTAAAVTFLYFLVLGIITLIFSKDFMFHALTLILLSSLFIVLNSIIISHFISEIKFNKRYNIYIPFIKYKNYDIIEELCDFSKLKEQTVIKDLKKAVKIKLIPQGHFSKNNMVFIISDDLYNTYTDNQAVYDRYFEKIAEDRRRMKNRTEGIQQIMDQGNLYIEKIHSSNDIIKDKAVSKQLDRMEKIVSTIFREVDINPDIAGSLGMFLNYYLPATEKLLDSYIELDEKQVKGRSISKTKKEIENALDTIITAFENILEKIYEEHEIDITSDIESIKIVIEQDGLSEDL